MRIPNPYSISQIPRREIDRQFQAFRRVALVFFAPDPAFGAERFALSGACLPARTGTDPPARIGADPLPFTGECGAPSFSRSFSSTTEGTNSETEPPRAAISRMTLEFR